MTKNKFANKLISLIIGAVCCSCDSFGMQPGDGMKHDDEMKPGDVKTILSSDSQRKMQKQPSYVIIGDAFQKGRSHDRFRDVVELARFCYFIDFFPSGTYEGGHDDVYINAQTRVLGRDALNKDTWYELLELLHPNSVDVILDDFLIFSGCFHTKDYHYGFNFQIWFSETAIKWCVNGLKFNTVESLKTHVNSIQQEIEYLSSIIVDPVFQLLAPGGRIIADLHLLRMFTQSKQWANFTGKYDVYIATTFEGCALATPLGSTVRWIEHDLNRSQDWCSADSRFVAKYGNEKIFPDRTKKPGAQMHEPDSLPPFMYDMYTTGENYTGINMDPETGKRYIQEPWTIATLDSLLYNPTFFALIDLGRLTNAVLDLSDVNDAATANARLGDFNEVIVSNYDLFENIATKQCTLGTKVVFVKK